MMSAPRSPITLFSVSSGRFPVFLILCLTAPWAMADGARDAHGWLIKMSDALQSLSYEGVFVHRSDDQLTAMKVVHLVGDRGEQEQLITLTGELREIIHRTGYPGHGVQANVGAGGRLDVAAALSDVADYYKLELGDHDRVAGRSAQMIFIGPRDIYRYGYRLWLDQATGLLLKSDLLALDGSVIEQVMFTSLNLVDDGGDAKAPDSTEMSSHSLAADAVPKPPRLPEGWTVGYVPKGFSLMMVKPVADDHNAQHMIYTDGLASVSIFLEASDGEANSFVGVSRMGAVSAYGDLMDGYQVTVVGEVPQKTVELIGGSIRFTGSE